ncbi:unnamed protein product [Rotaria sp. Silwood2]|nr:unnamed protein product [Rotaria sp. Silwood2]
MLTVYCCSGDRIKNTFLFDNEPLLYLALRKNGIQSDIEQTLSYSRSWDYSIKEYSRLMVHIVTCPFYDVKDNDPKHKSNISTAWKQDHHIKTLPWPSLSPDVNPIENLWSLFKIKVANRKPKTIKDLKRAIYKEWNDLPKELASKLVWSMKNRVEELIQSRGEYILY